MKLGNIFARFALLVAPWSYRNSELPTGELFISKGIFWTNLWVGTWERNSDWTRTPNAYHLPPEALQTFDNGNSPTMVIDTAIKNDQDFLKDLA